MNMRMMKGENPVILALCRVPFPIFLVIFLLKEDENKMDQQKIGRFLTGGILIVMMLGLSGCKITELFKTNDAKEKDLARSVVERIAEGEEEGLMALFSEDALASCTDFETGFAYAQNQYSGDYESMSQVSYHEQTHYDKGKHAREVRAEYEIKTSAETYFLYLYGWQSDTIDPSREGLRRILFTKSRAGETYDQRSGIYHPGWDEE